jgi:hypothetical protein
VTVSDDSVSRVISLRLDEATELADRPRSARPGAAVGEPAMESAPEPAGEPA